MKACVVGSTGYAGQQLVTLLMNHPKISALYLGSHSSFGKSFSELYPHTRSIVSINMLSVETLLDPAFLLKEAIDIIFFALPHGLSAAPMGKLAPLGIKMIDLGTDLRLRDPELSKEWYGEPPSPELLSQAVYGLSEHYREAIQKAQIIANPGCYATATLLAALPAIQSGIIQDQILIVDAKSGVSGAGRQAQVDSLFSESVENVKPYKVGTHRHTPEIEQALAFHSPSAPSVKNCKVMFSPSVVPMSRGILSAVYGTIDKKYSSESLLKIYKKIYENAPFIRIVEQPPITKAVRGSNYTDIWVHVDSRTNTFVAMAAIDNLMKGAAGQAVQNMNLMMGFEETCGLGHIPLYP